MNFKLKILESNKTIIRAISEALLPEVKIFMDGAFSTIKKELPNIVSTAIYNSPEYNSLINGKLKYEFGLVDADIKVKGLLDIWINNINYDYNPPAIVSGRIKSKFSASLIKIDFSDVLGTSFAEMTDIARGYSLPWLEWLLLDGTKTIIDQYDVIIGPNEYSRTGYAIMSPSSRSWSVPSEFAGSVGDNWITRSIDSASSQINQLLMKALTK